MKIRIYYLAIPLVILLLFSCSHKIANTNKNKEIVLKEGFVLGEITTEYKNDGCDYLIKVKTKDKELVYAAINLDDKLKQKGLKFQFKFKPIRAQRKGSCKRGIYINILEYSIL